MAIKNGVDVGALGISRGSPLEKPTRHESFSYMMLGAALGSLTIDAGVPIHEVVALCEDAVDQAISTGSSSDARHRAVATKLLRMAIQELASTDTDIMGVCGMMLARIGAAVKSPDVHDAIGDLAKTINDAQPKVVQ